MSEVTACSGGGQCTRWSPLYQRGTSILWLSMLWTAVNQTFLSPSPRGWRTRWDWRGAPGRPVDHVQQLLLLWPVRSGRKHFASSRLFIDVLVLSNHIPPRFVLSNSRFKRNSLALVYETNSTVNDSTLRLMNSNMKNKWGFLFFALMWLFWMNLYDLSKTFWPCEQSWPVLI